MFSRIFLTLALASSDLLGATYELSCVLSSVADPGCLSRIPYPNFFPTRILDPNFFHLKAQISIKEFRYFNPKNDFLSSLIPDPGTRGQKGTGSRIQGSKRHRIPDPDAKHWF